MQEEMMMIKGKRSKRPRPSSPLALTMATSSSSTAGAISDVSDRITPSNSGELAHSTAEEEEEEDMAHCLILLARGQGQRSAYQCKTCNKSFPSFQALGGHRASHKKPMKPEEKKPMMMREKLQSSTILSLQISNGGGVELATRGPVNKTRVHECSICGAEFGSGQALGGHMRRHRPIPAAASEGVKRQRNILSLDLNLPAPEDEHMEMESKFPFPPKEQVIVFSASPLIDCHY